MPALPGHTSKQGTGNKPKNHLTEKAPYKSANHRFHDCLSLRSIHACGAGCPDIELSPADERCRTDKLDGVIKHRSSRETTMVGRGASLDGRLFLGGTDGSNPLPSSGESGERRSRWPGRSGGCRPVPSNWARQGARQPASLRPRTRSSNPVPSCGESYKLDDGGRSRRPTKVSASHQGRADGHAAPRFPGHGPSIDALRRSALGVGGFQVAFDVN